MAKVKIQGNASGTGVLTVTAPNTSTDRTITLPDGDVTLGAATPSIDDNGNATAMTIDSSENVLIGKTTTALATAGLTLGESGFASITRNGYEPLNVNRLSSDGNVISVYKDSVVKGSIAVTGSGIGIQLGGTGLANTLDDYEEGTWTPALSGVTGSFSTSGTHNYTKVGRIVTLNGYIYNCSGISNTSANWLFSGLPFAPIQDAQGAVSTYNVTLTSSNSYVTIRAAANNSSLALVESRDGTVGVLIPFSAVGTGHLDFTITYATNA